QERPGGGAEPRPQLAAEQVVAEVAGYALRLAPLRRGTLGPSAALGEQVAISEPARLGVAEDDQRQIHHPAVERYGPVVVSRVLQLLQLLDDGGRVVGDEPPDIPEPEPEVDGMAAVVRGHGPVG